MIDQKTIDRINELARKSRNPEGLTQNEIVEQQQLRRAYIDAYKQSLRSQLESTVVVRPDGTKQRLADMKKKK